MALKQLPPHLQRELERWYALSCILIFITLMTIATIHGFTLFKLYRAPTQEEHSILAAQPITALEPQLKKQSASQEIAKLIRQHTRMLENLNRAVNAIPETISITQLGIEPACKIEYHGTTYDQAEISVLLSNLQQQGYQDIINLEIQPDSENIFKFQLSCKIPE